MCPLAWFKSMSLCLPIRWSEPFIASSCQCHDECLFSSHLVRGERSDIRLQLDQYDRSHRWFRGVCAVSRSFLGFGTQSNALDCNRYQSQQDAFSRGLYSVDGLTEAVTLRVDTTNVYPADGSQGGRPSIRIESKLPVNKGLVIGDFAHMPGSVCGSWPAC